MDSLSMEKFHKSIAVSADVCVFVKTPSGLFLLTIDRKYPPFGNALPGGHVDYDETVIAAAYRELLEETNLQITPVLNFVDFYDAPDRDHRKRIVSFLYTCLVHAGELPSILAGDDAQGASWVSYDDIEQMNFVADHKKMIFDAHRKIESLIE